ncbi:hypothetical protein GOBAR_AA02995 [Gossypium barbadense]|uniref:Retrotransposon Copia-like N-terminal domain-containing protein n=1 Tax=Gossypium barbadense TaxID=3634 RepID=A0A2P5YPX4_GOSBA|nr:hypothetical protein GOBAR_AA02995 [Gossypium barbadense]
MTNAEDDLPPLTNPEVLSINISSDFSSKQVNVRLDDTNYLLWKHQVFFTIHGHACEYFLDGSALIRPKVIVSETGETTLNDAYSQIFKQDCALPSWLLSTHGHGRFNTRLQCPANTRLVKEIYDTLTTCGSSVQEIEHIATILNGLPYDYDPFVAVITSSQESYALNRVVSVLMDAVSRLYAPLQHFPSINTTQVLSFPSNIVQPKTSQFYNPGTSSTTLQSPGQA